MTNYDNMTKTKLDKIIESQTSEPSMAKTIVKTAIVSALAGAVKVLTKKL